VAEDVIPVGGAPAAALPAPTEPEAAQAGQEQSRAERARRSAYRLRFVLVYFLLALVAGSGIGAFVVVLTRPDPKPAPPWSPFVPTGSTDARTKQIATHVGGKYHLTGNVRLVTVLAGHPQVTQLTGPDTAAQIPVSVVAVRPDTSKGRHEASEISLVDGKDTVAYTLCGLGARCAISQGKASTARHALLRREALELALDTFKYVPGTKAVVAYLPPPQGSNANGNTVFLQPKDVRAELRRPLQQSLSPVAPAIGRMAKTERELVDRVTLPRLYSYDYTSGPDLSPILVLTPLGVASG
jgi:hypothetical protein